MSPGTWCRRSPAPVHPSEFTSIFLTEFKEGGNSKSDNVVVVAIGLREPAVPNSVFSRGRQNDCLWSGCVFSCFGGCCMATNDK